MPSVKLFSFRLPFSPFRAFRGIFSSSAAAALALLCLLLAPAYSAPTNSVSRPVGFVRILVSTNAESLVSTPFEPFDPRIDAMFKDQLTGSTNLTRADVIRMWNPGLLAYTNAYKADFTGNPARNGHWFTDFSSWSSSPLSFYSGDGFVIANRQSATQTVFLTGTVVLDDNSPVLFSPGFNLFGYPFSARIGLNDTRLRQDGARGGAVMTNADQVSDLVGGFYEHAWLLNNTNSAYHGKWLNASTNLSGMVLEPGLGYWYQRLPTNSFTWQESRPYANLFPTNDNPPSVVGMTFNPAKDEATLTIAASGSLGEKLDIYYKDVSGTNAFTSLNWQIAAIDLSPGGQSLVTWTDTGAAPRGRINTVRARYYLVGRADKDSDGDRVPDGREVFVYAADPAVNDLTVLPFVENFETNTVHTGDLNGQNKWIASPSNSVLVQTNVVYEGRQAISLQSPVSNSQPAEARHDFVSWNQPVVWVDFYTLVQPASAPTGTLTAGAVMYFNTAGQPVVYDGFQSGPNKWVTLTGQPALASGTWARVTAKLDYSQQKWLLCINGQKRAENLGFASSVANFSQFKMTARGGTLDALQAGTTVPGGIYTDCTNYPDAWQIQYFGALGHNPIADEDLDGLTNAQEYHYGTHPLIADTDHDGMSDGQEVALGRNPLVPDAPSGATIPFVENFETNTVVVGDLNGQNGWLCAPSNSVLVQTNVVYEGRQAVSLQSSIYNLQWDCASLRTRSPPSGSTSTPKSSRPPPRPTSWTPAPSSTLTPPAAWSSTTDSRPKPAAGRRFPVRRRPAPGHDSASSSTTPPRSG